jgi:hypothetical protein
VKKSQLSFLDHYLTVYLFAAIVFNIAICCLIHTVVPSLTASASALRRCRRGGSFL